MAAPEKQWTCGCREVAGELVAKCSQSKDETQAIERVKSDTCYRDKQNEAEKAPQPED